MLNRRMGLTYCVQQVIYQHPHTEQYVEQEDGSDLLCTASYLSGVLLKKYRMSNRMIPATTMAERPTIVPATVSAPSASDGCHSTGPRDVSGI